MTGLEYIDIIQNPIENVPVELEKLPKKLYKTIDIRAIKNCILKSNNKN